jgi:hypothetical protein
MDWEFVAPMVVGVVLILTVGGVALLRPVAKRLGALLDVMVLEKTRRSQADDRRLLETMGTLNDRLSLLAERQDFTERLIGRGDSTEKAEREVAQR